MKNKLLYGLAISPSLMYSQHGDLRQLRGKAISEDVPVENVRVINASSNQQTYTDGSGKFLINAQEKDTLIFSGMLVMTKVLYIDSAMMNSGLSVVLESQVNTIEEVVVSKYKLTGNLNADSKNIIIKPKDTLVMNLNLGAISQMEFFDDYKSSPKNPSMPVMESSLTGIDFMMIGKQLAGLIIGRKKFKPAPYDFVADTKSKLPADFFLDTLKLKPDHIDSFLKFCENWLKAQPAELYPHNEMALMEFLIAKREDYPDAE